MIYIIYIYKIKEPFYKKTKTLTRKSTDSRQKQYRIADRETALGYNLHYLFKIPD